MQYYVQPNKDSYNVSDLGKYVTQADIYADSHICTTPRKEGAYTFIRRWSNSRCSISQTIIHDVAGRIIMYTLIEESLTVRNKYMCNKIFLFTLIMFCHQWNSYSTNRYLGKLISTPYLECSYGTIRSVLFYNDSSP